MNTQTKIQVYPTRYSSLDERRALFCLSNEDAKRLVEIEGAKATRLMENLDRPVISIAYNSPAWDVTFQA